MRGSATLHGMKNTTGERNRRLPFWKSSPALPDRIAGRSPVKEFLRYSSASFRLGVLRFSVANLDAGSIPNAPIPIPHGGASSPIAWRRIDGSGRYIDGGWLIVARAAR